MSKQVRSAYLHVPFCRHRCGYCNFTLVSGRDELITAYLDALEQEFSFWLEDPQPIDTLYFGGGTPSHLPLPELKRLLESTNRWLPMTQGAEVTFEMNPLDCTPDRLKLLYDRGINRISLGGQSFDAAKLKLLERDHDGRQLDEALAQCHRFFDNVSLDLIFGVPGESDASWTDDLVHALESPIQHLSTYGLTIEKGSAFYGLVRNQKLVEVDQETQLSRFETLIDHLTDAGWIHYEVSNFAQTNGHECRHNQTYWQGDPWWAFGPGAASFLPVPASSKWARRVNHRSTTNYIKRLQQGKSPTHESDLLTPEDCLRERLVFGLRQLRGVDLKQLDRQWGSPVRELFEPHLSRFLDQGWLQLSGDGVLRLTREGLFISDGLWPDLLVTNHE